MVRLDALPLTSHGKLDRKALPQPAMLAAQDYVMPQGPVETAIAALWAEVLGIERVGRHDNFFELGGHSLLAVNLTARLRQAGLQADVRTLFGQPTVAALAATLGQGRQGAALDGHPWPSPHYARTPLGLLKSQSVAPELSRT
ncbi:phosphopantetheine-binding protein [Pseudomonas soli]|uniref:Phosphopantetheine-binding protein n=1 Tax=Pseudomonas soli TaxID=1306993 RepID=A0ABU7GXM7_9PSED|nr:phosphopantetheine-binding protein [Pseudomonas soli]MEE1883776.1 phosphopantetheine-binding protein [Pseudomonas soli]